METVKLFTFETFEPSGSEPTKFTRFGLDRIKNMTKAKPVNNVGEEKITGWTTSDINNEIKNTVREKLGMEYHESGDDHASIDRRFKFVDNALKFMNYDSKRVEDRAWVINDNILLYDQPWFAETAVHAVHQVADELDMTINTHYAMSDDWTNIALHGVIPLTLDDVFRGVYNKITFMEKMKTPQYGIMT